MTAPAPVHSDCTRRGPTRTLLFALAAVWLVLGLALVAYPAVSDLLAQRERDKVVSTQQQTVQAARQTQPNNLQAELAAASAYNERLAQGLTVVTDPFDAESASVADQEYLDTLNLNGDGVMATLVIPSIGAELPIYHTVEEDVLQKGVGHMPGTALPVGGASTHSVLAGHTGLPSAKLFDSLDQLQVGDYFFIEVMGETHAYQVDDISVVLPEETDALAVLEGRDLVTLVTCTPYGVNSHRLLVRGTRVEVPDGWLDDNGDLAASALVQTDTRTSPEILKNTLTGVALGCGIALAGALVGLVLHLVRRGRNGYRDRGGRRDSPRSPQGGAHFAAKGSQRKGRGPRG